MDESQRYQRACLLAEQKRYPLAVKEALTLLAEYPNSDRGYNILSFAYARSQQPNEAIDAARQAIALSPQSAFHHYRLADAYEKNQQYQQAREAIAAALQIDPNDPDYYALASVIYHDSGQVKKARGYAEHGLQLNPEHSACLRLRVLCQLAEPDFQAAEDDIVRSLQLYPNHAFSHTANGWLKLHQGNIQPALDAFKTALQIDPNSDWARRGLMEAIKGQNWLYRLILRYELWQRNLRNKKPGVFWAVWLAIPQVRALYGLLILFTLLIRYIFDVVLRFHPYGCLLFTEREKWMNNCGAIALVAFGVGGISTALSGKSTFFWIGGFIGAIAYGSCWGWFSQSRVRRWVAWTLSGVGMSVVILLTITLIPILPPDVSQTIEEMSGYIFLVGLISGFMLWLLLSLYRSLRRLKTYRRNS